MLNIVALDTLSDKENSMTEILEAAYKKRDLPIKRLATINQPEQLKIEQFIKDKYNVFFFSLNCVSKMYLDIAKKFRETFENIFIVFVVDRSVDVSLYVRPSIRPAGILFIPLDEKIIYRTIHEIYIEFLRILRKNNQPVFTVKSKNEYIPINISDIFFFEAKNKKIAVKTLGQEILFYSNFKQIMEQLPDCFIRCHKGFVINTKQIKAVNLAKMQITMKDHCIIPISRTFKDNVKGVLNGRGD